MSEKRKRRFISPLAVAELNASVAFIRCRWKSGGGMNYSNAITIRQLEVMNAIAISGSIVSIRRWPLVCLLDQTGFG
ncbi:hypothetical protein, partial [Celeribacter baekdonensis]|uniref:hypothetical protein n=1 Tax=Celeribacter baekdonensis TaxID=875171 RepID=UPI0030DD4CB5